MNKSLRMDTYKLSLLNIDSVNRNKVPKNITEVNRKYLDIWINTEGLNSGYDSFYEGRLNRINNTILHIDLVSNNHEGFRINFAISFQSRCL